MGVVRDKLNVHHRSRRDEGRGGDVAAVLPQKVGRLRVSVPDLDEVISAPGQTGRGSAEVSSAAGGNNPSKSNLV